MVRTLQPPEGVQAPSALANLLASVEVTERTKGAPFWGEKGKKASTTGII